jgi:membrane protein YdbS with pleckstrin-like domain
MNEATSAGAADPLKRGAPSEAAVESGPDVELWRGRTRLLHFVNRLIVWLAVNVLAAVGLLSWGGRVGLTTSGAMGLTAIIMLLSALWLGTRPLLAVLGCRYRLTSQRLFIDRGILSRTVDQTELVRVDDVRMHKSFTNRMFGLGSVQILSTDATDREIVVSGIAEPEKVAELIRERMRKLRQKSLFVENL